MLLHGTCYLPWRSCGESMTSSAVYLADCQGSERPGSPELPGLLLCCGPSQGAVVSTLVNLLLDGVFSLVIELAKQNGCGRFFCQLLGGRRQAFLQRPFVRNTAPSPYSTKYCILKCSRSVLSKQVSRASLAPFLPRDCR